MNTTSFIDELLDSVKSETNSKGYYDSFTKNIFGHKSSEFEDMFSAGDGGELYGKACAVHSSSMLSFNMFSWISEKPLNYDGVEYNEVYFEVHIPTLRGTNPANMDVVLVGRDTSTNERTILFIESKYTEYFSNNSDQMKKMGITYDKPERYFVENGTQWAKLINKYRSQPSRTNRGYYDGIKQEICHMIGISNLRCKEGLDEYISYKDKYNYRQPDIIGNERFIFKNILFRVSSKYKESSKYEAYEKLYNTLKKDLEDMRGDIDMQLISYSDIWQEMKDQVPSERKKYIVDRYMKYAFI